MGWGVSLSSTIADSYASNIPDYKFAKIKETSKIGYSRIIITENNPAVIARIAVNGLLERISRIMAHIICEIRSSNPMTEAKCSEYSLFYKLSGGSIRYPRGFIVTTYRSARAQKPISVS